MTVQNVLDEQLAWALAGLERKSTKKDRDNLVRFGIAATNPLGVSMANIQRLTKQLSRNHALAAALWETNIYEARLLTAFVDEPARVTSAQMDRWCREFDNWGVVDTLCFKLFDQTPHAWDKVSKWASKQGAWEKRAAFALLASLAGHDKSAGDDKFIRGLELVEREATDERNFVKKGVSWALRMVGRRNAALNVRALALARRLSESADPTARWMGKDALRDFTRAAARR
ncbi:MAG: DNA alkylation repair protein [Gemmatimonadota bacterium]